jgi:TolB-like protein
VAFGVIWQIVKSQSAPRMLAVLPFEYQGAVEYELRANGVIDEIITRLGKIGGVQLQALQSAKRYRDSDKRPGEIGVELGVDYLLGGTIGWDETGQDDGRVRIVPELIRVADEAQLWMQPYDTAYAAAILDLPAEVAERVAQALAVGLGGAEREAVRARPTESVEAHILWLQGNNELGKMTVPAFQQALEYYQGAIAISPTYARAHAGMAMALIELGGWWSSLEPGVVRSQARTAALAALEYDSTLAEAHMALGRIKALFDWDWAGADSSFRRGIELNPSATHARIIYANYLIMMGRFEEALAIGRQALEGDPFSQPAHRHVGWALDRLGRDAEALEHYQRALELAPNLFPPHLRLVEFYLRRGLLEEASRYVEQAEKLPAVAQVPIAMGHLGYYYARLDRRADALRVLEELEERAEREFVNPGGVALVYLGLGQIEKFLELEEQSFQVRTLSLVALKVRWLYDPLRDDPRFQDLLRRMNFPD